MSSSQTFGKVFVFSSLIIFFSISLNAQYRISKVSYGGSGCPVGSASVVLTDDQTGLSILFDQMSAESGRNTNRTTINLKLKPFQPIQFEFRRCQ